MTHTKIFREITTWIGYILIATVISIFVGVYLFQPTKIVGNSMYPTLKNGERIYVSKLSRVVSYTPNYGDIVIIDSRVNRNRIWKDDISDSPIIKLFTHDADHTIWVKRVIGKPGDRIRYKNGKLERNGKLLEENYTNEPMFLPFKEIIVPDGHVVVMGDNRNYSSDSREIGPVPITHVLGKKMRFPFID